MLCRVHLLIREWALLKSISEDEAKDKWKRKFDIDSFATISEKLLARVCGTVEESIHKHGKNTN